MPRDKYGNWMPETPLQEVGKYYRKAQGIPDPTATPGPDPVTFSREEKERGNAAYDQALKNISSPDYKFSLQKPLDLPPEQPSMDSEMNPDVASAAPDLQEIKKQAIMKMIPSAPSRPMQLSPEELQNAQDMQELEQFRSSPGRKEVTPRIEELLRKSYENKK